MCENLILRLGGYCTLSTGLPIEYHQDSTEVEPSCGRSEYDFLAGQTQDMKKDSDAFSVTFHITGYHNDRSTLCLYTVGSCSCPVSAAWQFNVAAQLLQAITVAI